MACWRLSGLPPICSHDFICKMPEESASQGRPAVRSAAEELPHGDSWPEICAELVRNGFSAASVLADGIEVQITKETERE